jgi:hypothetical protein
VLEIASKSSCIPLYIPVFSAVSALPWLRSRRNARNPPHYKLRMNNSPKNIGEGAPLTNDTLLEFPTSFPIKAMGRMKGGGGQVADPEFAQTVLAIVQKHAPDFDASALEMRPSKNGTFVSVTATITAQSKAQLDAIYRELTAHPSVLMAL